MKSLRLVLAGRTRTKARTKAPRKARDRNTSQISELQSAQHKIKVIVKDKKKTVT